MARPGQLHRSLLETRTSISARFVATQMRWEYRPGSTPCFVWQQNRSDTDPIGNLDFSRDRSALFSSHPDNIFLVRASYWLSF